MILLSVAVTASMGMDVPREFKDKTDFYNLFSQCFGEEAMALYYGGIKQACKYCMEVQVRKFSYCFSKSQILYISPCLLVVHVMVECLF